MITFEEVKQKEREYRDAKKELVEELIEQTKGARGLVLCKKFEDELIKEMVLESLEKCETLINHIDCLDSCIKVNDRCTTADDTMKRIHGLFKLVEKLMK